MNKAYIYPLSARYKEGGHNPYLENFMDSISSDFEFVNRYTPSSSGVFNIVNYILSVKYVFFHWPEDIPERKFGLIQTIGFFILIPILKLRKIKIIYIVHNKISHTNKRYLVKKNISKTLIRQSFLIITHSKEGVSFINSLAKRNKSIFCFPHPVDNEKVFMKTPKEIDILIWGNIAPYKGVHRFLEVLQQRGKDTDWNIVIAGKVSSKSYFDQLKTFNLKNLKILNEFLDNSRLNDLISKSKIVLFPYHKKSILSSGAFARTIVFPVEIIGPDCGAFLDFSYLNNVNTFQDESLILDLVEEKLFSNTKIEHEKLAEIAKKYSWKSFGEAFISEVLPN